MKEKALHVLPVEDNAGDPRLLRKMFSTKNASSFELTHFLRMSGTTIDPGKAAPGGGVVKPWAYCCMQQTARMSPSRCCTDSDGYYTFIYIYMPLPYTTGRHHMCALEKAIRARGWGN
jgi:hypothetical protein